MKLNKYVTIAKVFIRRNLYIFMKPDRFVKLNYKRIMNYENLSGFIKKE